MTAKSKVTIRKFRFEDIPLKIKWINDPANNRYLHYDLPLEYEKTCKWFENNKDRADRYDAIIEVDGIPVGLIGLLSIKDRQAEYYVTMGESAFRGQGIACQASKLLLEYAFRKLHLAKVYLYTEADNIAAQKLFRKVGFTVEGLVEKHLLYKGRFVDRYVFGFTQEAFFRAGYVTPIQPLGALSGNRLYMKREDMIPYSFGGNKARKAELFFQEIDAGLFDCVVTYGSSHSNHCRVVANMAAARNIPCLIIGPEEVADDTFNSQLMRVLNAEIRLVPIEAVHDTIEDTLAALRAQGKNPYFIPGGGHGNIGTEAYVQCYDEIRFFEADHKTHFDYIFFASGTGTTQAGLVCGQLLYGEERDIVGISIARRNPRGRDVVLESIREYLGEAGLHISEEDIQSRTIFLDDYVAAGYGQDSPELLDVLARSLRDYGIPMDTTYTGKAFLGMEKFLAENHITGKNILFIHTGGTPLFFDGLNSLTTSRPLI